MDTDNVVPEQLRAIRATLEDHGRRIASTQPEVAPLGQQFGGLTTAIYNSKDDSEDLRSPSERPERAAGFVDNES